MWFKKKSQISGFNSNTAFDGRDWRTLDLANSWSVSQTPPSAADAGNYFYLPALGYYRMGLLIEVGYSGYYWLSSALSTYNNGAYTLNFTSNGVRLDYAYGRVYGFSVGTFE